MQSLGLQNWDRDSALGQDTVNAVLQQPGGVLWVATSGGLFRYDGAVFRRVELADTQPGGTQAVEVTDLAQDIGHRVYAATPHGLYVVRDGFLASRLFSDPVTRVATAGQAVAATGADELILTRDGAASARFALRGAGAAAMLVTSGYRFLAAGTGEVLTVNARTGSELARQPVAAEMEALSSCGWDQGAVEATDAGLQWTGPSPALAATPAAPPGGLPRVTALLCNGSNVYSGNASGNLLTIRADGQAFSATGTPLALGVGPVRALFRDREGMLWAAGSTGIARISAGGTVERRTARTLRGVHAFYEDPAGNMWLASEFSGLTLLRQEPFRLLTARDGLASSHVRAGLLTAQGRLWLATAAGVDTVSADGLAGVAPGTAPDVSSFALAQSGATVYAGTAQGLVEFRNGRAVRTWTAADGLPDDLVRSVLPEGAALWAGTRHGLALLRNGRVVRVYSRMDGLGSDTVGAILRTPDGTLLVATGGGLDRLDGDQFVALADVPQAPVTALAAAADGGVWIATAGSGLFYRDAGGRARSVHPEVLPQDILAMLPDGNGHVWLRDTAGLYRVDAATLLAPGNLSAREILRVPLPGITREDSGHPAAWLDRDGAVSFATDRGVVTVSPDLGPLSNPSAQAFLESVRVDGGEVPANRFEIALPPGRHSLVISYGNSDLASPAPLRFRYRLDGADTGWTDAGTAREASYAGLAPGRYLFRVESQNSDGTWGPQATLGIRQRPRFYQASWFYALLLAGAAAVVSASYRLRVRYVRTRYGAVLAERARIAREIHDTLAQGYVAVGMQLDIASRLLKLGAAGAPEQIAAARQLVRENLEEARSSIWNLRVQGEEGTLPARLASSVGQRQPDGPEVRLEVHGTYRPVAAMAEQELLRIAQEAVANARRHAGAAVVRVSLTYGGGLRLQVSDDGKGIAANGEGSLERHGHFGIAGMRERAAVIGASFTLQSAAGQGTRVEVTLPLSADEEL